MPNPYIEFKCTGIGPGALPEETAIAAVGSKIYLMGGCIWTAGDSLWPRKGMALPTHVHTIDAASPGPPEIVRASSELNSGKRSPVAWTVGGKIYLMPKTFVARETPGDFECLDPACGSWAVLPSPPLVNDISKFTIKPHSVHGPNDPLLLIKNNTVLGSSIVIVTHAGDIYSFDTTYPDKGWTSVTVLCGSSLMCASENLNFLPFDGTTSIPVGDNLILSHCSYDSFPAPDFRCVTHFLPRSRNWTVDPYTNPGVAEKMFLEARCGVLDGDAYACRLVAKVDSDSSTMLSLHVKRVELPVRREELVCSGPFHQWENIVRIGDGLVLIIKAGGRERSVSHHCSLNVVRIENKADDEPVFAILSSVLLVPMGVLPDHVCSFLFKDGNFTTGF